ncbi:diguanylate cyclase [Kineococcus aurantiacus]|uniref:Diguanylate cyclase (GGDEF)-like protein n=1 Tax=Kineococcus aurantiacus TaxID=37633 RepID=A0A7Y9J1T7_9ACTN|nr:diguanylate cyclase (GGDEF)-like protein [Kineococcus aurantiacus]
MLVASVGALAALWCLAVTTVAGPTDGAAVLVEVAASAILTTTAALAPAGGPRRTIGLLAAWATATALADSVWLLTSGSPAVAYAHGQYEPAASVALFLLRYPVGALALALAAAGHPDRRLGPAPLSRTLAAVQVTASAAALVVLGTPIGGFIADSRPYSLFLTFDVLLAAAAVAVALRLGATRPSRATALAVLALCGGDGAMLVALLEDSAVAAGTSYTCSLAGVTACVVVQLSTRRADVRGAALPPVPPERPASRLVVRVLTRLVLPVGVLVVSVHRLGTEDALPAVHLGLVAVALGLALLDALGQLARAETDEAAAAAAVRDELTGAWSRRGLTRQAALRPAPRAAGPPRTWALLVLDLDGFKAVNDVHGHAAGDVVLRVVVQRVADVVGDRGAVARLGGDEFVVLLHDELADVPARLVEAVSQDVELPGGTRCAVSTSVGAVEFDAAGWDGDLQDLLAVADRRMYRDKRGDPDGTGEVACAGAR